MEQRNSMMTHTFHQASIIESFFEAFSCCLLAAKKKSLQASYMVSTAFKSLVTWPPATALVSHCSISTLLHFFCPPECAECIASSLDFQSSVYYLTIKS